MDKNRVSDLAAESSLTVTLPKALADIVASRAAHYSQSESETVAQLLLEALVYCHGMPESQELRLLTPVVRMANALLVQAIDSRVDTIQIVPSQIGLRLRYLRDGELVIAPEAELVREMPPHLHGPIFARFEHMAKPFSGPGIVHPDAMAKGVMPITHSGRSYDVGVQFLSKEPDAIGETLELTFRPPLA